MRGLKRLLISFIYLFSISFLSGCAATGGATTLTNAEEVLGDVQERNKTVLKDLNTQGIISDSQYQLQVQAIENNVNNYKKLLNSTSLNSTSETRIKEILNACVAVIGDVNGKNGEKLYGFDNDIKCPNEEIHYIDFRLKEDSLTSATNVQSYSTFINAGAGKKFDIDSNDEEWTNEHPLEFLDEGALTSLQNELNRKIWILDPEKFKDENDWRNCLEIINKAKKAKDSGDNENQALMSLVRQYFKVSPYTAFNFNLDDLLKTTEDNSSQLGLNTPHNDINKDIVISGTLTTKIHTPKLDGDKIIGCESDEKTGTATVGVYSFRVREFNADFINLVNKGNFTTDRYVEILPESGDGSQAVVLLMEYPVAVINSLKTSGAGNTDWEFGFEESSMRVNIYNGEMLIKDENGDYVKINKEDDGKDRIYRVLPEAVGTNSEKGKTSSFIPYNGYVEGDTNFVDINPDDPMNDLEFVQITESVNVLGSDDIDKDSSFYVFKKQRNIPYEFLSHDGFSFSKYGDIYTLKDNSTKDELKFNGTLLKASENQLLKENRYSLLRWCENVADMSIVNIESLWDIYDSIYMSKNSIVESSSGFNNHDDYILYKLYTKYLDDTYGSVDTVNGISYDVTSFRRDNPDLKIGDLFSPVIIYNSLVKSFNGSSVLNNFMNNYEIRYSYILNNFDFIPFAYVDKESSGEDAHLWTGYIQNKSKYSGKFHDYFKNCGITEYLKLYSDGSEIYSTFNFSDVIEINRILSEEAAKVVDPLIGSPIDLTSRTYDIRYDDSVSKYIINIGGKEYYAQKIRNPKQSVEANVVAIEEMDTLYLALTDYLELMYMPGVIEDETFIAPGRRVKIEKFSGTADEVIGYYADRYGDPILLNDSEVGFKVSDIVDFSSGVEGFYSNVAKSLAFDGRENSKDVNDEINKSSTERIPYLKNLLSDSYSTVVDSGFITDKPSLEYSVFFESIYPILKFTSYRNGERPALDSMDVGNDSINPSLYYGLCLNTHAFATGLYTQWIDANDDVGDVGSLSWWNGWLSDHGYYYYIDFNTLKNAMSGVYNVSLGSLDDTIIFDLDVLNIINKDMVKTTYTGLQKLIRTATVLIGSFLLVYGLLMLGCWLIDVNLVNGPGFLTIVTLGRLVAMRDTSEIPRISDGKTYVDFKYLLIFMIVLMIIGIVLITVDIHSIWSVVKNLFSGVFDLFSDLMFNR